MKRLLLVVLSLFLSITLFSCDGDSDTERTEFEMERIEAENEIVELLKTGIYLPINENLEYMNITKEDLQNVQILDTGAHGGLRVSLKIQYGTKPAQWFWLGYPEEGENRVISALLLAPDYQKNEGEYIIIRADRITNELQKFLTSAESQEARIKNVKQLVSEIGDLTDENYSNKNVFAARIRRIYELLDDTERQMIDNYNDLTKAEKQYWFYLISDRVNDWGLQELKDALKNPASLQVHSEKITLCYDSTLTKVLAACVEYDYSAQNSFGGYVRSTFNYCIKINEMCVPLDYDEIHKTQFYNIKNQQNGEYVFYVSQLD